MTHRADRPRGWVVGMMLVVAVLALSSAALFIRWLEEVPSVSIAAWRMGLASLMVGGVTGRRLEMRPWQQGRANAFLFALLAACFLALHFFSWIASLKLTSVANSSMLVATSPLFVALGSAIFLRERPSTSTWIGLCAAIVGASVLALGGGGVEGVRSGRLSGDLLALLGAAMAAGYLLCGRRVAGVWPTRVYLFWVYAPAFIILLVLAMATHAKLVGWSPRAYFFLLCIALGPQAIGHSTLNWALRHFPATTVSLVTLAEPIGAALLAWAFLAERPGLHQVIGGGILLSGLYWASLHRRAERRRAMDSGTDAGDSTQPTSNQKVRNLSPGG